MKLANANPGDGIIVYCDPGYHIVFDNISKHQINATLVARPPSSQLPMPLQGCSLLAWKNNEQYPKGAWKYKNTLPLYQSWMAGYDYGWWADDVSEIVAIFPNTTTQSIITATIDTTMPVKSAGMRCAAKHCNEFNPYAEPNQPDGKFICFSCRSIPSCMR